MAKVVRSTTVEEYEAAVARYDAEADRLRALAGTPVGGREAGNDDD